MAVQGDRIAARLALEEDVGMSPRLFSAEDIAAYVGVSRNTFLRQVDVGTFPPALRIGKRLLWDIRAIDQRIDAMGRVCSNPGDPIMEKILALPQI